MKPPFPSIWDASMLSAFRSCPHKFALTYLNHWKPKQESHHLHAGGAFASGLEATRRAFYEQHMSPEESLELGIADLLAAYGSFSPPEDSPKSASRMAGALEFYFSHWPLGADPATPAVLGDRLGIEFSFAQPLPFNHPISGEPLIYCGRADQVVDFAGGVYVEDDKTASQLGASWSRQWDLRSQFTGYCWAARAAGIRVDGVLVRGISILKTKYDCAEAVTYRPAWQVDRWLEQTLRDIKRAQDCWEAGWWDWSLDHACTEYGGCNMRQVCLVQDPQPILELNFERRYWNPLTREETLLDAPKNLLDSSPGGGHNGDPRNLLTEALQ